MEMSFTDRYRLAMNYGTCMGLFWIAKFVLMPLGLRWPFLQLLYVVLTLAVPVVGYIYAKQCRDRYMAGVMSVMQALTFCFWMFAFAALLTAVEHYVYFAFIDKGYLFNTFESLLEPMREVEGMERYADQMDESITVLKAMSPINLAVQMLLNNIYYGCLMAIPIALIVRKR